MAAFYSRRSSVLCRHPVDSIDHQHLGGAFFPSSLRPSCSWRAEKRERPPTGGGAPSDTPLRWVSSGVHSSVKVNAPARPVVFTTGWPRRRLRRLASLSIVVVVASSFPARPLVRDPPPTSTAF